MKAAGLTGLIRPGGPLPTRGLLPEHRHECISSNEMSDIEREMYGVMEFTDEQWLRVRELESSVKAHSALTRALISDLPMKSGDALTSLLAMNHHKAAALLVDAMLERRSRVSPTEVDLLPETSRRAMTGLADAIGLSFRIQARGQGFELPIQRAQAYDLWVKRLEEWATEYRALRNDALLTAIETGTSPGRLAGIMGVSKTAILKLRGGDSPHLRDGRNTESRLRGRALLDALAGRHRAYDAHSKAREKETSVTGLMDTEVTP